MFKIFYGESRLVFTDKTPCDTAGEVILREGESFANIVEKLEKYKIVWVVSPRPGHAAETFMANFRHVDAAGGLVTEPSGRLLLIYRNGRWDLPKGHREAGEEPAATAVREVGEETGVCAHTTGKGPFNTLHFYRLGGEWVMKRTYWYPMKADRPGETVPQTGEGITRVAWLTRQEVAVEGQSCFPSVREVLIAAGWLDYKK